LKNRISILIVETTISTIKHRDNNLMMIYKNNRPAEEIIETIPFYMLFFFLKLNNCYVNQTNLDIEVHLSRGKTNVMGL
jgi:hypothetical protein